MIQLMQLSMLFFRIGLFGFGGGYVMLPVIYQGIQQFGIMSADEFSKLVALSQVTPGPITINAATYVGFKYAGLGGSIVATIAVTIPSLILVLLVMKFLEKFKESKGLQATLVGIRPATVGLMASAVIFLAETSVVEEGIFSRAFFEGPSQYVNAGPMGICILIICLSAKFDIGPIKLTFLAALIGAGMELLV